LVQAVPTLFGIMLLTFLLTRLSPADPIDIMVGGVTDLTAQDREDLREAYGLNRPLPLQFVEWSWGVLRLDFGQSFFSHRPAIQLIAERIPNSLQLAVAGLLVALAIGVPLGVLAALFRGGPVDHAIRVTSVVLNAVPDFFLGLLFVLVLGVQLKWFPIGSMNLVGESCGLCWDRVWHMVGPVLLYANGGIATYPRYLRTEILEILGQDYVRTARSKGLRERAVVIRHVLRNALIPIVSLFGGILTLVVGGAVVVEQVFNWPGLGRLLFEAANNKDYPVVQAAVVIGSVLLLLSYILRDIAYAWVDPRIKTR
jgi:peptide/nickel transport system permease protein